MNCPSCQQVLPGEAQFCSHCGASTARFHTRTEIIDAQTTKPQSPTRDPLVGVVLDSKYELVERLGSGGMGTVYRARRLHIGDDVAVKILRPELVLDAEAIERFRREARSAAMISHPNVVIIHDFSDARSSNAPAYIVMELVRGTSLRILLKREGRLTPGRAVALMREICAGVGIAHRRGVLHRDLKPDNVIVTPAAHDGAGESAKVVDFGLAKLRDVQAASALTQSGAVMGTLYYMSPEQCSGEELDARSDVYSLGAMLYEMLTGDAPFQANSLPALIAKHLNEPPPAFPVGLQIPSALATACYGALGKRREQRPADAIALSKELQAALASPVHARVPFSDQSTQTSRTQTRSYGWVKVALGGLASLLLIAAVGLTVIAIRYRSVLINVATSKNTNREGNTNTSNPTVDPARAHNNNAAESDQEKSGPTQPELVATWTGTYGPMNQAARLIIDHDHSGQFDGVLEQGGVRVAIIGTFDTATYLIKIKETQVLSGNGWSLGEAEGRLSSDGRYMSGTGQDDVGRQFGLTYVWAFSKP